MISEVVTAKKSTFLPGDLIIKMLADDGLGCTTGRGSITWLILDVVLGKSSLYDGSLCVSYSALVSSSHPDDQSFVYVPVVLVRRADVTLIGGPGGRIPSVYKVINHVGHFD